MEHEENTFEVIIFDRKGNIISKDILEHTSIEVEVTENGKVVHTERSTPSIHNKTESSINYEEKSENVENDEVDLKDSEQLALINKYIDMALDTNDKEWFMELAVQKNKLIDKNTNK